MQCDVIWTPPPPPHLNYTLWFIHSFNHLLINPLLYSVHVQYAYKGGMHSSVQNFIQNSANIEAGQKSTSLENYRRPPVIGKPITSKTLKFYWRPQAFYRRPKIFLDTHRFSVRDPQILSESIGPPMSSWGLQWTAGVTNEQRGSPMNSWGLQWTI